MDIRFKQANKEAWLSLLLTVIYLLAWGVSAYLLNADKGIVGMPIWFEIACIFVPIGFILLCYCVVKVAFKNITLEDPLNNTTKSK